jgi:hypothetical protein
MVAPCGEASVALKNVTAAQSKTSLEASFVSGIAVDLKVSEDLVAVTSVTTSNSGSGGSTRRRILLETAAAGDALDVAFKVTGEASFHSFPFYSSGFHLRLNLKVSLPSPAFFFVCGHHQSLADEVSPVFFRGCSSGPWPSARRT